MTPKTAFDATPHGRAFLHTVRLLQDDLEYRGQTDKAWLAALTLFAQVKEDHNNSDTARASAQLRPADYWERLTALSGFGTEGSVAMQLVAPDRPAIHEEALLTVSDLIRTHGCAEWDFSDSYWFLPKVPYDVPLAMSPEAADLMVEVLRNVQGKYAWCLFDGSYQLACRLVRKNADVAVTIDNATLRNALTSLNRLHGTSMRYVNALDGQYDDAAPYDIAVAVPVFGMRALPRAYAASQLVDVNAWPGQQNRPELFAIRAAWEKTAEQCAILVPPNVLFSTGQEQRFREHLVFELNAVEAVVNLPARQLMGTGVPAAVLVLNHRNDFPTIRFVDAAAPAATEKEGRGGVRIKSPELIAALARRAQEDAAFFRDVARNALPTSDISLYPPRYVSSVVLFGETVKLKEIIAALIRPPAKPVGRDEAQAMEINISDLHQWGYVTQTEKQVAVRETKLQASRLRDGDLIFSIKGSLGKVGLFRAPKGDATPEDAYVVSQSCIALRLFDGRLSIISPIALYMYLRSDIGKAAVEALSTGAVIPHIQPAALLDQLQIPVLPPARQDELEKSFHGLMALQQEIRDKQRKLDAMANTYWHNPNN